MHLVRLKHLLFSGQTRPVSVLRGPFRGARFQTCVRDNLRKIFGLYEHEINPWLERVLPQVDTVIDVGANDGYFTFGCAAALRRLGRPARILALEPQVVCCEHLTTSARLQAPGGAELLIERTLVGRAAGEGQTSLDMIASRLDLGLTPRRALVKIDVEGAEMDVIAGGDSWLHPSNFFLIEVHQEAFLDQLRARFLSAGLALEQVNQQPLFLLGAENRQDPNWWLVSKLE